MAEQKRLIQVMEIDIATLEYPKMDQLVMALIRRSLERWNFSEIDLGQWIS